MRDHIAERDYPAVALAGAGGSPVGLASGSEAPPTPRGFPAPRDYPRYGFNDMKLGGIWKERPVEMYVRMEREAAQRRASASRSSDEKCCKTCRCYSWFEGMTDECCLTKRGDHCNMIGQTSGSKPVSCPSTASPASETMQVSRTPKKKCRAELKKPGTDMDQVSSTVIMVVDDQDTVGEIDDRGAVAAFAKSFALL